MRNWLIGYHIAEYELRGAGRAGYGDRLLANLAAELEKLNIRSCGKRQLYQYLRFYQTYPQIVRILSAQLERLIPAGSIVVHENIGQLNTYVSWYKKNMMTGGDNPPVGILLCTDKDHALVEYALAGMDNGIFVSKYQLELPQKEEMARFIEEQIKEA